MQPFRLAPAAIFSVIAAASAVAQQAPETLDPVHQRSLATLRESLATIEGRERDLEASWGTDTLCQQRLREAMESAGGEDRHDWLPSWGTGIWLSYSSASDLDPKNGVFDTPVRLLKEAIQAVEHGAVLSAGDTKALGEAMREWRKRSDDVAEALTGRTSDGAERILNSNQKEDKEITSEEYDRREAVLGARQKERNGRLKELADLKWFPSLPADKAPVAGPGPAVSQLEELCRRLADVSAEWFRAQAAQNARLAHLTELTGKVSAASPDLPNTAPLADLCSDYQYAAELHDDAVGRRRRLFDALQASRDGLDATLQALHDAKDSLYFDKQLHPCDPDARGARRHSSLLESARGELNRAKLLVESGQASPEQLEDMRKNTIPRLEANVKAVETAIAGALAGPTKAAADARAARDAAQAAHAAFRAPSDVDVQDKWSTYRTAWNEACGKIPAGSRNGLPQLPLVASAETRKTAGSTCLALSRRVSEIRAVSKDTRDDIAATLQAITAAAPALNALAFRVTDLRSGTLSAISLALDGMEVPANAPVQESLERIRAGLGTWKEVLENANGGFDRLETIRRTLLNDQRGARVFDGIKTVLEPVAKALEIMGDSMDTAMEMRAVLNDIKDETTWMRGVSRAMKIPAGAIISASIPGAILGGYLTFVATSIEFICDEVDQIMKRKVKDEFEHVFDVPKPERHLYTAAEVEASCNMRPQGIKDQILVALQVRRALALARAQRESEVLDVRK